MYGAFFHLATADGPRGVFSGETSIHGSELSGDRWHKERKNKRNSLAYSSRQPIVWSARGCVLVSLRHPPTCRKCFNTHQSRLTVAFTTTLQQQLSAGEEVMTAPVCASQPPTLRTWRPSPPTSVTCPRAPRFGARQRELTGNMGALGKGGRVAHDVLPTCDAMSLICLNELQHACQTCTITRQANLELLPYSHWDPHTRLRGQAGQQH